MNSDNNCDIQRLRELFTNKKNIAIIGHVNPDADALSSLVILKYQLENYFNDEKNPKQIDIYADVLEIDELYAPMLKKYNLNGQKVLGRYDLAIGVDCTDQTRFGSFRHIFDTAYETLNIDHHETNAYFADNNFVYKTSSTAELLFLIMTKMKVEIIEPIGKLVYAGIITDTNNLSNGSISDKTYSIINYFLRKGYDISKVQEHFFKNNSVSKIKLLEKAIHSLNFACNGKLAIMKLNKVDYNECEANPETDTLGIVDHAIGLKDVKIAMMIMKQEDNSYRISLRSKQGINVGEIAAKFGGGGHETMAAFSALNISDFKDDFLKICNKEFGNAEKDNSADNLFFDDTNQENKFNFDF